MSPDGENAQVGPVPRTEVDTPPGQQDALAALPSDPSANDYFTWIARNLRLVPFEVGVALNRLRFSALQAWRFPSSARDAKEDAREIGRRAYYLRATYEGRCAIQAEVVEIVEKLLASAATEYHQVDACLEFIDDLVNPFRDDPYPPDDPDFDAARAEVCDDFFRPVREAIDRIRRIVCKGLGDRDRTLLGLGELIDQGVRRPDSHRRLCVVETIDDESDAMEGPHGRDGRSVERVPPAAPRRMTAGPRKVRNCRTVVTCPPSARRPGADPPHEDWLGQIVLRTCELGITGSLPARLLGQLEQDEATEAGRVARVEGLVAAVRLALEDRPVPGGGGDGARSGHGR
jgi:hypothetical protein